MSIKIASMTFAPDGGLIIRTEDDATSKAFVLASEGGQTIANLDLGHRFSAILITDAGHEDGAAEFRVCREGEEFHTESDEQYHVLGGEWFEID